MRWCEGQLSSGSPWLCAICCICYCSLNISLQGLFYIDFPQVSIAHTILITHDASYPYLRFSQFEFGYKGRVTTRLACSRQIILIDWERGRVMYSALCYTLSSNWLKDLDTSISLVKIWTDEWLLSWQSPYFSYIFEPWAWIACPMFNVQMKTDHTNQVCYWHFISSSYNNAWILCCFINLSHWAETAKIHS